MTLKDYYESIQDPKKLFIDKISSETMTSVSTIYKWISGEIIPPPIKKRIISEITGISESELFPEKS